MKIRENVLIAELTTMRLGGPARYVIEVETPEDVLEAYEFAEERGLATWAMGAGANTIGRDEGFPGVIILNKIRGLRLERTGEGEAVLTAGGGEVWDDVVALACENGLSGIEAMSKIPGTAGAAPVQNIGAYGQEVAQVLREVAAFDTETQEFAEIPVREMKFDYRSSIFNSGATRGRYFITEIRLGLRRGGLKPPFYTSLQRYVDEHGVTDFSPASVRRMVSEIRAEKLPDPQVEASAGSFFKNVYLTDTEADRAEAAGIQVWRGGGVNKINSGWLIEQAGLAGRELHGFRVSEKAALILINQSAEVYSDLAAAREEIRRAVYEKYGFWLEQEPEELTAVNRDGDEELTEANRGEIEVE